MGGTCGCDRSHDGCENNMQKRRYTPQIISTNLESQKHTKIKSIIPDDYSNIETEIFGVDQNTIRLLLNMDSINPINNNLTHSDVDIESTSKQDCIPHITVSQIGSNRPQLAPTTSSIIDQSDLSNIVSDKQRKSHLMRMKSNNDWESEDIDDLAEEMAREYHRLSQVQLTHESSTQMHTLSVDIVYPANDKQRSDNNDKNLQINGMYSI
eukprot:UN01270